MGCQGGRGRSLCALGALLVCALVQVAPASASITVGDVSVGESGAASFTITRTAGFLAGATEIAFRTSEVSAGASDYTAERGGRAFDPVILGTTQTTTVAIAITPDALDEPDETFRLLIAGPEVADGEATATIADDDPPPALSVLGAAPAQEGAAGAKATFVVRLSAPSGRAVSVGYATANESATAGQDYTARAGTLELPAGQTEASIDVGVLDDAIDEPAETFALQLAVPEGASAGDSTAVATIVDDDEPASPPAPEPKPSTTGSGQPSGNGLGTAPATGSPSAPTTGSTAATGALGLSSPRLRRPSTVLVTISCPATAGSCKGRITLFSIPNRRSRVKALRKERKLGRVAFSVQGGRSQTLSLTLRRTDLALLRRTGRMKVRAYAITQDGAGRTGVRSVGGTLIARTAHSSPSSR